MRRFLLLALPGLMGVLSATARAERQEPPPLVEGVRQVVNLLGSFLLAALMALGAEVTTMPPTLRLALTTGVMGGFTTYSTFSFETMRYLQEGAWGVAIGSVLLTVFGCLAAALLGWAGARWLIGIW